MEEMIEKQITVLIPKSHEDKFNEIIEGFDKFQFDYHARETDMEWDILSLYLSARKLGLIKN